MLLVTLSLLQFCSLQSSACQLYQLVAVHCLIRANFHLSRDVITLKVRGSLDQHSCRESLSSFPTSRQRSSLSSARTHSHVCTLDTPDHIISFSPHHKYTVLLDLSVNLLEWPKTPADIHTGPESGKREPNMKFMWRPDKNLCFTKHMLKKPTERSKLWRQRLFTRKTYQMVAVMRQFVVC